jgi:hypothetical protein
MGGCQGGGGVAVVGTVTTRRGDGEGGRRMRDTSRTSYLTLWTRAWVRDAAVLLRSGNGSLDGSDGSCGGSSGGSCGG